MLIYVDGGKPISYNQYDKTDKKIDDISTKAVENYYKGTTAESIHDEIDPNITLPIPEGLIECLFLFAHQIEINDYQTSDHIHELKMNLYWQAIKKFYTICVNNGMNPNDPEMHKRVKQINQIPSM